MRLLKVYRYHIFTGTALKCYECYSITSWADCMQKSKKGPCSDPFLTRCGKLEISTTDALSGETITAYGKGCAKTCNPERDLDSCKKSNVKCTMNCCSGDYCNAGSSLASSLILSAACALISVVFTKMH